MRAVLPGAVIAAPAPAPGVTDETGETGETEAVALVQAQAVRVRDRLNLPDRSVTVLNVTPVSVYTAAGMSAGSGVRLTLTDGTTVLRRPTERVGVRR